LCGQSGSGKTYTLGVVLERLVLETDIRIGVIDPNSDYVNLATLRPQADTGLDDNDYRTLTEQHASIADRIHVFGGEGSRQRLVARYGRLSLEQHTMVLGIDPIRNPEEYNAFLRTVRTIDGPDYSLDDLMGAIRASFDNDVRRLAPDRTRPRSIAPRSRGFRCGGRGVAREVRQDRTGSAALQERPALHRRGRKRRAIDLGPLRPARSRLWDRGLAMPTVGIGTPHCEFGLQPVESFGDRGERTLDPLEGLSVVGPV